MKVQPRDLLLGVVMAQQEFLKEKAKGNLVISLPKINQNVSRERGRGGVAGVREEGNLEPILRVNR